MTLQRKHYHTSLCNHIITKLLYKDMDEEILVDSSNSKITIMWKPNKSIVVYYIKFYSDDTIEKYEYNKDLLNKIIPIILDNDIEKLKLLLL